MSMVVMTRKYKEDLMYNKNNLKTKVRDFWGEKSCGAIYAVGQSDKD